MGDVLVMVARAGGDLDRALQVLDGADDPEAAVHMASMRDEVEGTESNCRYKHHHLSDYPAAAGQIGEWLMRPSITKRIEAAVELIDDPDYDDVLALGM
jgi:hypothetical protein